MAQHSRLAGEMVDSLLDWMEAYDRRELTVPSKLNKGMMEIFRRFGYW